MSSQRQFFGTDGIRGLVGKNPITPEFVLKLGWAVGKVLARSGSSKVLIGKDTRISGYMMESALEAGLSAAGIDVCLLGPMPTPAIAYLTRTLHAQVGIVISASHNPYHDNGIKFFGPNGDKLPDEVELAIEQQLDKPMTVVDSAILGKAKRIDDAPGRYIEFCKSALAYPSELSGLKIVVDCANGATYHIAPNVFTELGAKVIPTGITPDGLNINKGCGATEPETLQKLVLEHQADLGVALDGDGDRVVMVDAKGELVDGDEILYIIAKDLQKNDILTGGVVGTLMSNLGLEQALVQLGIHFKRTNVGDRYILQQLRELDWQLGGETSGHIICLGRSTTGDGIVAALQVIASMLRSGNALNELKQGMTKLPQTLVNVKVTEPKRVMSTNELEKALVDVEKRLAKSGRVLIRPSGTEPVVRIMVEGQDIDVITELAAYLADVVEKVA